MTNKVRMHSASALGHSGLSLSGGGPMCRRILAISLTMTFLGCQIDISCSQPAIEESTNDQSVLSVHWKGTKAILADTNSSQLMEIARLQESDDLRVHFMSKLSRAPWVLRGLVTGTNISNVLIPVIEDIVRNESLLQLSIPDHSSLFLSLTCHCGEQRSKLWQTNLAVAMKSLTGKSPTPIQGDSQGWILDTELVDEGKEIAQDGWRVAFIRSGDWVYVTFERGEKALNSRSSVEFDNLLTPPRLASNSWVVIDADLPRLSTLQSGSDLWFAAFPDVKLSIVGEDGKVVTTANLEFRESMDLNRKAWIVPTNYIQPPLTSFTALRGITRLLRVSKPWQRMGFEETPEQAFLWADAGRPMFTYVATPLAGADEFVGHASRLILHGEESWSDEAGLAGFKMSSEYNGVEWQGLPYLYPFIKSTRTNGESWVLGGTFPQPIPEIPLPSTFYEVALNPENLVYYDWEQTSQRLAQWLYIGQFIRFVSSKPQLPFESSSVQWIKAIESIVGDSVTRIHQESPTRFNLSRSSSLGFTAIELHLILDWLESPEFPRSLNTFSDDKSSISR